MVINFYKISKKRNDILFAFIDNDCLERFSDGEEKELLFGINIENEFKGNCDKCVFYEHFENFVNEKNIDIDYFHISNFILGNGKCDVIGLNNKYYDKVELLNSIFSKYIVYLNENYS